MICSPKSAKLRREDHPVAVALKQLQSEELSVELVTPEEQARWNKLIRKKHYLKEHRLVGESLHYVAKQGGEWIALLGWSSCAFHLDARDRWIGWTDAQRHDRRHWVVCNARFVVLRPKSTNPNLASRVLALNLKRLGDDWFKRYQHPVVLAETFVDPERFEGTCYRAANWMEIGVTKGFGRSRLDFYQLHQKPKAIFLYRLRPDASELLSAPVLPEAWVPYERPVDPLHYPLSTAQTRSLFEAFTALRDPRRHRGWRHRKVASILVIAVAAMIAGNNTFSAIGQFAKALNQNQLRSLRASRCRKTRQFIAPSESTIRRVIQRLDPTQVDSTTTDWLRSHLQDLKISALAVDGKCVRTASKINGQSIQLFSGLDTQTKLICGQIQIDSKTNEIPSLKVLIKDLDLRGALITADAIHTQKATAIHLVEDKQADFLLVVKDNQPKLFDRLTTLFAAQTGVFFPSRHLAQPRPRTA